MDRKYWWVVVFAWLRSWSLWGWLTAAPMTWSMLETASSPYLDSNASSITLKKRFLMGFWTRNLVSFANVILTECWAINSHRCQIVWGKKMLLGYKLKNIFWRWPEFNQFFLVEIIIILIILIIFIIIIIVRFDSSLINFILLGESITSIRNVVSYLIKSMTQIINALFFFLLYYGEREGLIYLNNFFNKLWSLLAEIYVYVSEWIFLEDQKNSKHSFNWTIPWQCLQPVSFVVVGAAPLNWSGPPACPSPSPSLCWTQP